MATLRFSFGTMNSGKSTLALQLHHSHSAEGRSVLLLTRHDRDGARVTSRVGLSAPALVVDDGMDLYALVRERLVVGEVVDVVICDEAQFYRPEHVDQLGRVVDELDIDVHAFGLLADFTSHLFPGSKRFLELADVRQEIQLDALCWCGRRGTQNARTVDGEIVYTGEQVVVDDGNSVAYEVLCRAHWRAGVTRATADARPDLEVVTG
ncbi:MAG: thymidine kinase [Nitriliruptorales bacterium]|nr:thymidine kinase [Nitriliruptorales bacterium]